ncbi:MAG: hypothetical protein A2261_03345 [Candidatus Magasanikbacteria bacterium RIFOXYA2_FULL_44_8]|uniref:Colicin V production protein n=1 Tax=Candidatus Magasanikbacteria bacterium RIFOXYA2_FULL_44_8 TaxID=1798696 RepID=A0A1F6NIG4_9BACT|nr:MAG: hypothetical protein A2261_03345 [Candidatus Magasanikbacteria bacterium RIFOXYA2_FULL_44_8]
MSIFDIVLLLIIACFGIAGLWFGIVRTIVSLVGSVAAVYLATRYYAVVADWLISTTGWNPNFSRVVIFIVAFIIINRLVVLLFWLINKVLHVFTSLPIIRGLDRLAGMAFGLLEGGLVLSVFFYFIVRYPIGQMFMDWIATSRVMPYLGKLSAIVMPLLPDALRIIRSTIEGLF